MCYRVDSNGKEILVLQFTKIYPVNPVCFNRIVWQQCCQEKQRDIIKILVTNNEILSTNFRIFKLLNLPLSLEVSGADSFILPTLAPLTVTTAQFSPLRWHKDHQKWARDKQQAEVTTGTWQKGILENGNRNEVEEGEKRVYRKKQNLWRELGTRKPAKGIFLTSEPLLKWLDVISVEKDKEGKE
jgi:hypothetical protein